MSYSPSPEEQGRLLDYLLSSFAQDASYLSGMDIGTCTIATDEMIEIKDLDGHDLFREYPIKQSKIGNVLGIVRSSGRGTELPLIDCMFFGRALFDPKETCTKLLNMVQHANAECVVSVGNWICYSYPRVGLVLKIQTNEGVTISELYDAHVLRLVKRTIGSLGEFHQTALPKEGEYLYSYGRMLPEGGDDAYLEEWEKYIARAFYNFVSMGGDHNSHDFLSYERVANVTHGLELNRSETARLPIVQGALLPAKLLPQETPVYCAVATGQMMMSYIGLPNLLQQDVALLFKTGSSGTTNDDMISGLNQKLAPLWHARIDLSPDFDKIKKIIGSYIPAKSGIPGHARLLRGWREYLFLNPQKPGEVEFTNRFVVINDPYPTNAGQIVLENFEKPIPDFYRNLLYLTHAS